MPCHPFGGGERTIGLALASVVCLPCLGGITTTDKERDNTVVVRLDELAAVGSAFGSRAGAPINGWTFVDIGVGRRVAALAWDVVIERIDLQTHFDEAGIGLLDISDPTHIQRPYDAPMTMLGGSRSQHDADSNPLYKQHVAGYADLSRYWWDTYGVWVDATLDADAHGRVYLEVFDSFDEDDDWGVTASDTPLNVDSTVTGWVTLYLEPVGVVPAPGAAAVVLGVFSARRRRAGRP